MPFVRQFDETEVLDRAGRAFWSIGYEATAISDLVAATGLNRGSLYAAFGDKRRMFLKALARYDSRYRKQFLEPLAAAHPPRGAIIAAFEQAARAPDDAAAPAGCLLVNTALEVAPHDAEVRGFVTERLAEVEAFFRDTIERGQRAAGAGTWGHGEVTAGSVSGLARAAPRRRVAARPRRCRPAGSGAARLSFFWVRRSICDRKPDVERADASPEPSSRCGCLLKTR